MGAQKQSSSHGSCLLGATVVCGQGTRVGTKAGRSSGRGGEVGSGNGISRGRTRIEGGIAARPSDTPCNPTNGGDTAWCCSSQDYEVATGSFRARAAIASGWFVIPKRP